MFWWMIANPPIISKAMRYDVDSSGCIDTAEEFTMLCTNLLYHVGSNVNLEEADAMIS